MIGVFGMGLAVILYLCVTHKCYVTNQHLISTAPLGKALTISQVASHIAPVTIPLLMSLTSYHLAAKWLKASAIEGPDRPSPMQLGLLLSIFNSANIPSLFSAFRYFLGLGQTPEQKSFPAPPILRRSTLLLFTFLVNAYLISGSDAWLHVTSKAVVVESLYPYLASEPFGRAINNTRCEEAQTIETLSSFYAPSCGQLSGGSGGDGLAMMPGLRTLSNSSSTHRIAFADDQTAIVVPFAIPSNISYTANSLGIKSSCKSITKQCLMPEVMSIGLIDYGPNAFLNLNCSGESSFNATFDFLMEPLDDTGNGVSGFNISSNPFKVGAVITSMAYYDEDNYVYDDFVKNSGWFIHGNKGAWNVIQCNVAAVDVTYTYKSSTSEFTIKSSTPSSLRDARAIITFGLDMYRTNNPVATAVDGAGLQTETTYEEEYALELSRQTIARGAVMYVTQDTTDIIRKNKSLEQE
ncbi:hypothetical protein BDQ17DRAFT_963865 [Cyathus striatus]|nr:hypothetical protein BDQ17DRAFT_963865 [Cyathus striatus]